MTSSTSAERANLNLSLPGNWLTVDLESLGDEKVVRELVGARAEEIPALAGHEAELAGLITRSLGTSREHDVVFAAVLAEMADDEAPVVANLALAITATPATSPSTDAATSTEHDRSQGRAAEDRALHEIEARIDPDEQGVQKRTVDHVELPAGPALRIARLHDVPLGGTGMALSTLTVQYWLPTPDRSAIAVLSFATPSLGRYQDLARTFDAIAVSARFESPVAVE